jgi:hypothetical protein
MARHMLVIEGMTTKNTVPSAPEDLLEPGQTFADDGRKRTDEEFVGANAPDADPETPVKERSVRRESESRK